MIIRIQSGTDRTLRVDDPTAIWDDYTHDSDRIRCGDLSLDHIDIQVIVSVD